MAEYLEGSEEMFVEKMNAKAKELGMNDTTFKNCHGIDEDGHETSAYDIALMSQELMTKHPSVTNYTTIWMDTLRDGQSELVNTNKLVRNYTGATGLKTGSTSVALFNLSATATRNDLSLIAVIMRGQTSAIRFSEAQKLLDYGFSTYAYKQFGNKDDVVKSINVEKGIESTVNVVYEKDAGSLIKKGREKDVTQTIDMEETISAPVYKGQKIGEAIFTLDNEEIGRVNLVAQNDVKKTGIVNMVSHIYALWFNVLR